MSAMSSSGAAQDRVPVVVIGAGLAGLSAALHLAERGVLPIVLEADQLWPGGRLSGGDPDVFQHRGRDWKFPNEHGVHAVWGGYANLRALLERFTDTRLIPSPGEEWINRWGREVRRIEAGNAVRSRWIPAPFHYLNLLLHPAIWQTITPLDFLSLPGFLVSILLTVGVDPMREGIAWDGLRMREYFRGWTPNLRATFVGLGANLLAAPPEEVDLAAFIAALRFYTVLRRDAWNMAYFPSDAHSSLIQPLREAVKAREGWMLPGTTALCLERDGDGWRIIVEDAARQGLRALYAEQVVLATNASAAERLLLTSPDTASEAGQLIFPDELRNAVTRLWFDQSPRAGTPGGMFTGDFVPDNFFWLQRLYPEYAAWHAETGGSALEMHLYGTDALMDQPDANLIVTAVSEARRAWPELREATLLHAIVRRNSKAQTRLRIPDAHTLAVETPWAGIVACGDWLRAPEIAALWMERSVATSITAANVLLTARGLDPYPVLQPDPPEALARALGGLVRGGRKVLGPPLRGIRRALRRRNQPA